MDIVEIFLKDKDMRTDEEQALLMECLHLGNGLEKEYQVLAENAGGWFTEGEAEAFRAKDDPGFEIQYGLFVSLFEKLELMMCPGQLNWLTEKYPDYGTRVFHAYLAENGRLTMTYEIFADIWRTHNGAYCEMLSLRFPEFAKQAKKNGLQPAPEFDYDRLALIRMPKELTDVEFEVFSGNAPMTYDMYCLFKGRLNVMGAFGISKRLAEKYPLLELRGSSEKDL